MNQLIRNARLILYHLIIPNHPLKASYLASISGISINNVLKAIAFLRANGIAVLSAPTPIGGYVFSSSSLPKSVCRFEENTPVKIKGKKPTARISRGARDVLNVLKKAQRLMTMRELSDLTGINAREAIAELRAKGVEVMSFPTRCGGYGLPRKNFVKQTKLYRFAA